MIAHITEGMHEIMPVSANAAINIAHFIMAARSFISLV